MKNSKTIKNLVIVESPSKAHTIEKYLGSDYAVIASKGHICDLATTGKGGLGIDVDNGFSCTYVVSPAKKATVKELKEKVKASENVLLATDPDREGEAIAYHLANQLNIPLDVENRIVFHEVTKPAVTAAIQNPKKVALDLVDSQETRRILDRIIGFKLSTLLNNKIKSKSAGRVQSVALKLIVDREEEIKAFIPEEYWTINANMKKGRSTFVSELTKIDGKKAEIHTEQQANTILDNCKDKDFIVADTKQEKKHKKPKAPYITSTLQQDASNRLSFSSKKTMQIAQKLYEGINIGSGTTGLITYMRSDSNRLSDVFIASANNYIDTNYGKQYCGYYHAKVDKNAQDAHEAIRPTNIYNTPDSIRQYLTNDEYKLYNLIYLRTLAALMSDAIYDSTTVKFNVVNYEFTSNGKTLVFDGYLKVYPETDNDKKLPVLEINEALKPVSVDSKQHFTEPPLRYTEARLIKAMEENGIGRPSTYATIIDTIIQREYVTLEKSTEGSKTKVFVPTEQGVLTTNKLDEFFSSIINVKYTANMESELDRIAEGKLNKLDSLNAFYNPFMELLDNAKENMEKLAPVKAGKICPECGNELVIRKGKFGQFIACSNYPTCKYSEKMEAEKVKEEIIADTVDYGTCPDCGSKLVQRTGRFGKFIACGNYPTCKYIQKKEKKPVVQTGENCPECGSPLVERTSRFGTKFVGCSNYPKCRFILGADKKAEPKKVTKKKKVSK